MTTPSPYMAGVAVSADGRRVVFESVIRRRNVERVSLDVARMQVGAREAVTEGTRYWFTGRVPPDSRRLALAPGLVGQEDIFVTASSGGELQQLTTAASCPCSPLRGERR